MTVKLLLIMLTLIARTASAEAFYLSEIFANAAGARRDAKAQWLELTNIANRIILISSIKVEIYESGALEPTLVARSELSHALAFDDRLLLAAQPDLGLDGCLTSQLDIISLDDFYIPNAKKLKICVTINDEEPNCSNLGPRLRFYDGVSLYRSFDGANIGQLWLSEPCLMGANVFATPGLPEQACVENPDFATEIIADCRQQKPSAYQIQVRTLEPEQGLKPVMSSSASSTRKGHVSLSLADKDVSDLWRLAFCAAPAGSHLICHELSAPMSMIVAQHAQVTLPSWPAYAAGELSAKVSDLFGLSAKLKVASKVGEDRKENSFDQLALDLTPMGGDKLRLVFSLGPEQVPVNYQIHRLTGEILAHGALTTPGPQQIIFDRASPSIQLSLQGKSDQNVHELRVDAKSNKPASCATHDINYMYLIIVYVWLAIKRRA